MECDKFAAWLENRDTHDISEADKARRHADCCPNCHCLLENDEALDRHIGGMLARENVPASLKNKVDLNLDRMQPKRKPKSVWAVVATLAIILLGSFQFQGWFPGKDGQQSILSLGDLGKYILADYQKHGDGSLGFDEVDDAAQWLRENLHVNHVPPEQIVAGYEVKLARFCYLGKCLAVHMIYEKAGKKVSVFVVEKNNVAASFEDDRLYTVAAGDKDIFISSQHEYLYAAIGI